ncbi:ParB-like protein [delta proteobacterium NaphS2]|nr:ParB-like protein [delta proteobacterium NaphS2]
MGSTRTVDIHLLELRYAHCRIMNHQALKQLRDSIETYGQIVPALVVTEKDKLILVDGYLRVRALRACGKDQICVHLSEENEQNAMFSLLAKTNERQWEAIEQSVLLQELHRRFGCSLSHIAARIGRDKSFVKRRLDLVEALPENILKAVISGTLSTWSASRVMAPLARANIKDAQKLMAHLENEPLSTRELAHFYEHYQKSNRSVRDRMLENPFLFIKVQNERIQSEQAKEIHDGPEGKWFKDIKMVYAVLGRLLKTVSHVHYPKSDPFKKQNPESPG